MDKYVYHSSKISNLKEINPNISTHKKEWIYATKDKIMSAFWLNSSLGDLSCHICREEETNLPMITERFKGAFVFRYQGKEGSIYVLPSENFLEGQTQWNEEVICKESVKPVKEIVIKDVKSYLLEQEKEGNVIINFYPNRPYFLSEDDEDLIIMGVIQSQKSKEIKETILNIFNTHHNNLLERLNEAIKLKKYNSYDDLFKFYERMVFKKL